VDAAKKNNKLLYAHVPQLPFIQASSLSTPAGQCVTSINNREQLIATQSTPDVPPAKAANPIEAVKVAAVEQIAPKPTRRWRAWVFQATLIIATAAFGVLVVLASMFNYFPIDLRVTQAVQSINLPWFDTFMLWVSIPGYPPWVYILIGAVVVFLFVIGLRWEAVVALLAAAVSGGLGQLIKMVVHRPRPGITLVKVLSQLNSYSFPSGHVLTYTAFFGFLFFLCFTLLKPSFLRTVLFVILGSLVGLIGISRIDVGDHWASDVIGAYLLGSLCLVACVYIYRWGKTRFFVKQPLAPEKPEPTSSTP
jgi:membrane-associated phospholipid phosphatase